MAGVIHQPERTLGALLRAVAASDLERRLVELRFDPDGHLRLSLFHAARELGEDFFVVLEAERVLLCRALADPARP